MYICMISRFCERFMCSQSTGHSSLDQIDQIGRDRQKRRLLFKNLRKALPKFVPCDSILVRKVSFPECLCIRRQRRASWRLYLQFRVPNDSVCTARVDEHSVVLHFALHTVVQLRSLRLRKVLRQFFDGSAALSQGFNAAHVEQGVSQPPRIVGVHLIVIRCLICTADGSRVPESAAG